MATTPIPSDLSSYTIKALRQLAKDQGITVPSRFRKAEIVSFLEDELASAPTTALPAVPTETVAATEAISLETAPLGSSHLASEASDSPQVETGLPIPDQYHTDRLVLMPQDPQHIFAYWELSDAALSQARNILGEDGAPVLIIYGPHGPEQRDIDLTGGNYYLNVAPETTYSASLALRGSQGQLVSVVTSTSVTTAAAAPSSVVESEWMVVDDSFDELMLMATEGQQSALGGSSEQSAVLQQRIWAESGIDLDTAPSSHSLSSHSLSSGTLARPDQA